ncbi:MAG TPA: DUF58 domain-containing protein [Dehalococcoidia bacterium]|nr:DUF58 domain-containing protein [Dehalococcoidia bacterium]
MAEAFAGGAANPLRPELLKRVRRIEIRSRRLVNSLFLGEYHAVFRGRGIEFSEVREYVPGDEVRSIDWNVTARLNAPFVKKFVEERELTVLLIVDVSASGTFGTVPQTKREIAAEITALLALSAINNQDRVGLIAFSDRIERYLAPAKGQRHVLRLVRELLGLEPQGRGTSIATALDYASHMLNRRSVVFLISDFMDAGEPGGTGGYDSSLRVLARRHDLVAITLTDPRELELPDIGIVELEDAETGERVLVDTSDEDVRARYRERTEAAREQRERLFHRNSVDAIEIGTGSSYIEPLMRFFRARAGGVRRQAAG